MRLVRGSQVASSKDRYTINASDLHESPGLYSDHSSRGAFVLVSGALSWSMDRALTLRLLSGACSNPFDGRFGNGSSVLLET